MTIHIPKWLAIALVALIGIAVGVAATVLVTDGGSEIANEEKSPSESARTDGAQESKSDLELANAICERILHPEQRTSLRRASLQQAVMPKPLLEDAAADLEATSDSLRELQGVEIERVVNNQEELAEQSRLLAASEGDPGVSGSWAAALGNLKYSATRNRVPGCYLP